MGGGFQRAARGRHVAASNRRAAEVELRGDAMRYLIALLLFAGCATAVPPQPPPCPAVPQFGLPDVQKQIDEYLASGRYDADFAAVVDSARAWLEERAPKATRPAIVLDI